MHTDYYHIAPMFPFGRISSGKSIVIYGMGHLGKEYVRQVLSTNYVNIKYAVDKNWNQIQASSIPVLSPDVLKNEHDAEIVVAVESKEAYQLIRNELMDMGISNSRIIHSICGYSVLLPLNRLIKHIHHQIGEKDSLTGEKSNYAYIDFLKSVKKSLKIKYVRGKSLVRIGKENDGGYIMLDEFSCGIYAYSFGINNDVSWDHEIAERDYDVYMYDHTIDSLPYNNARFHFYKQGITGKRDNSSLFITLEDLLENNGHENAADMIMKMDIEGFEWDVLNNVSQDILSQFSQIVIEFHSIFDYQQAGIILSVLHKLNKTHQVVHVHGNNYSNVVWYDGLPYPDALEVTYVSRKENVFEDDYDVILPTLLDMPNCPYFQDIPLGDWNNG